MNVPRSATQRRAVVWAFEYGRGYLIERRTTKEALVRKGLAQYVDAPWGGKRARLTRVGQDLARLLGAVECPG